MQKHLLSYAHLKYYQSQRENTETAKKTCRFDVIHECSILNINSQFAARNKTILEARRGAGYWLWKPYLIDKTLKGMSDGDILFYCDAGISFLNNIDILEPHLNKSPHQIIAFDLGAQFPQKVWTKRDCFLLMGQDNAYQLNSSQCLASYIYLRKNVFTVSFMKEWLKYGQDERCITDTPNQCGLPNYPEFKEHRHDQSIYSILVRKYRVITMADISQYGNNQRNQQIPQILSHHRNQH